MAYATWISLNHWVRKELLLSQRLTCDWVSRLFAGSHTSDVPPLAINATSMLDPDFLTPTRRPQVTLSGRSDQRVVHCALAVSDRFAGLFARVCLFGAASI